MENLERLLKWEVENPERFGGGLPWRWVEVGEMLVEEAGEDLGSAGGGGAGGDGGGAGGDVRVLLRELREVRWGKARVGLRQLEST